MAVANTPSPELQTPTPGSSKGTPRWLTLAIASGATAAFNGVFAKLTTTAQTHNLVESISTGLGLSKDNTFIEVLVRGAFFGCNLLSNALMWILFTRALTASNSTTRVSILNTAANFLMTAMLGMLIFSENLPLGWWGGALMLVGGSVIVGARDGGNKDETVSSQDEIGDAVPLGVGAGGLGASALDAAGNPYADSPEGSPENSEDDSRESYTDRD